MKPPSGGALQHASAGHTCPSLQGLEPAARLHGRRHTAAVTTPVTLRPPTVRGAAARICPALLSPKRHAIAWPCGATGFDRSSALFFCTPPPSFWGAARLLQGFTRRARPQRLPTPRDRAVASATSRFGCGRRWRWGSCRSQTHSRFLFLAPKRPIACACRGSPPPISPAQ